MMMNQLSDYSNGCKLTGRERANTWPIISLTPHIKSDVYPADTYSYNYNPADYCSPNNLQGSQCSSALSLISESNESFLMTTTSTKSSSNNLNRQYDYITNEGDNRWLPINIKIESEYSESENDGQMALPTAVALQKPATVQQPLSVNRSGHPSYVELITQAILASPEQRMTLAEIYDWMVGHVEAFKNQRNLHSSTGWKNSVRHNLSLHNRFKRLKRNGMDKPSWWTVDLSEEARRYRSSDRHCKSVKTSSPLHSNSKSNNRHVTTLNRSRMSSKDSLLSQTGSCYTATSDLERLTPPTQNASTDQLYGPVYDSSQSCLINSRAVAPGVAYNTYNISERGNDRKEDDLPMNLAEAMVSNLSDVPPSPPLIQIVTSAPSSYNNCAFSNLHDRLMSQNGTPYTNQQLLQVKMLSGDVERVSLPSPIDVCGGSQAQKQCQTSTSGSTTVDAFALEPQAAFACGAVSCAICGPAMDATPHNSATATQFWPHLWTGWMTAADDSTTMTDRFRTDHDGP